MLCFGAAHGAGPGLGLPLDATGHEAAQSVIWPNGENLPLGRGTVQDGAALYVERCIACHGVDGRGGIGGELAGGNPDLRAAQPDQNIGTFWPYATTLFDFVRRAMPLDRPWSLSDAEVYAVVAYLLHRNGLLDAATELDAATLRRIQMPNRNGFDAVEAPRDPAPAHAGAP